MNLEAPARLGAAGPGAVRSAASGTTNHSNVGLSAKRLGNSSLCKTKDG